MGAQDYVTVRGPTPPSYAAPLIGQQLGQDIAALPDDYLKGRENQRTIALQNAFQDGLPTKPDGTPDINAIDATLLRLGGGQYAQQLRQFLFQQEQSRDLATSSRNVDAFVNGGQQPNTGPTSPQSSSGPANVTARPQSGQPRAAVQGAGGAPPQQVTVMQVLAAQGIPNDQLQAASESVARQLGVDPTEPIDTTDPQVSKVLGPAIAWLKKNGIGQVVSSADPSQPLQPISSSRGPTPGDTTQATAANSGRVQGPAAGPQSTPSTSAPRQPLAAAASQGASAPTFVEKPVSKNNQPAGQTLQPGAGGPPFARQQPKSPDDVEDIPGTDDATINRLRGAAAFLRAKAAGMVANNPAAAAALEASAKSYDARAESAFQYRAKGVETEHEHALKNTDLIDAEKEARANNQPTPQANETRKQEIKQDVAQSEKTYGGINAASTQYQRDLKPYLQLSKSILNQPEMYSGFGADRVLDFNRVKAAFGAPQAAVLQEALSKVTAASVLGQINTQKDQLQEAGGSSGRIFAQQVSLVEKAAPAISNTTYGNRFLVNVAERLGELSTNIAQQARDYRVAHGHLDTGFDQQISDYLNKNPIFTPQELRDPKALGAPDVPDNIKTPQQLKAWEAKMGLEPGDPFRTPAGVKYIPRVTIRTDQIGKNQ